MTMGTFARFLGTPGLVIAFELGKASESAIPDSERKGMWVDIELEIEWRGTLEKSKDK